MQGDTHSFVVRIWHEAVDSKGHIIAWRGAIDHVGSGQRLYFHDLYGIVRFIQEQAEVNPKGFGSKWRSLLTRIRRTIT